MARIRHLHSFAPLVLTLAIVPIAGAQRPDTPPARPAGALSPESEAPGLDAEELGAERLRSFLERRLDRARAQQHRLEEAIERLKAGASVEELRAEYRDLFFERERRRDDENAHPGPDPDAGDAESPRDGRAWRDRRAQRWDPELRAKMLEFLAEEFPDLHERVGAVLPGGPEGPEEIDPRVERRMAPLVEMMRLKDRDPEMFALRKELWAADRAAWQAAQTAHRATGEERARAAEALHGLLERQFDLQLREHQLELDRLESRLANARREAAQQAANRDELINERLLEILARQADRGGDDRPRERRVEPDAPDQPAP